MSPPQPSTIGNLSEETTREDDIGNLESQSSGEDVRKDRILKQGSSKGMTVEIKQLSEEISVLRDKRSSELSKMHKQLSERMDKMEEESKEYRKILDSMHERTIRGAEEEVADEDVLEARESVALCLDGFNDIIFNGRLVNGCYAMDRATKRTLRQNGLDRITHLLDPEEIPHYDPAVEAARLRALAILPDDERKLCEALAIGLYKIQTTRYVRSLRLQHPALLPRPDRATALQRILEVVDKSHLPTLEKFLKSDPKRPGTHRDDLLLFAPDGTYKNVLEKRGEVEKMKVGWEAQR